MSMEHILAGILIAVVIGVIVWMKFATDQSDSGQKEEK